MDKLTVSNFLSRFLFYFGTKKMSSFFSFLRPVGGTMCHYFLEICFYFKENTLETAWHL